MSLTAADYQKVSEMYARVNFALDGLEPESWLACYTQDGAFEVRNSSGRDISRHAGHAQLQDYMQRVLENPKRFDSIRHWNLSLVIEPVGDAIEVTSYLLIETTGAAHTVLATGVEHALLEKAADAWLFKERKVVLDSD